MRKFLAVGIALVLISFFANPASACKVDCAGGSCSGTLDCHCDGDSPHCTDAADQITQAYVSYLQTWNTPGLQKIAAAASKVLDASGTNDLESYQRAMKDYSAAKEKLTKGERQIISAWDGEAHASASGPQQN